MNLINILLRLVKFFFTLSFSMTIDYHFRPGLLVQKYIYILYIQHLDSKCSLFLFCLVSLDGD